MTQKQQRNRFVRSATTLEKADAVDRLIIAHGSQKAAAEALGVIQQTISLWHRQRYIPERYWVDILIDEKTAALITKRHLERMPGYQERKQAIRAGERRKRI